MLTDNVKLSPEFRYIIRQALKAELVIDKVRE